MDALLLPGNAPFVVAIGLMVLIGLLEGIALLLGLGLSDVAENLLVTHFAIDHVDGAASSASAVGQFLGWLHVGRVPLLVLLVLFLMGFAMIGLAMQSTLGAISGHLLPAPLAAALVAPAALPFVRATGALVAGILPHDETSAISEQDFIGRVATITGAEASVANPSEARMVDESGQIHYLRVEPDDPEHPLVRGDAVLIVARVSGSLYRAIPNPRPDLL
ncbi:OB-fold-containig protein [Cupriavidus sp. BIS7]|uniref:OB-fold-containig protein n=1 Tax=Cupriavidus sp. BIS7 TaxID=1217718 RepID=UPI000372892F|nr:OB-fold-containig protein [Cupriavidus sp. BIS7]